MLADVLQQPSVLLGMIACGRRRISECLLRMAAQRADGIQPYRDFYLGVRRATAEAVRNLMVRALAGGRRAAGHVAARAPFRGDYGPQGASAVHRAEGRESKSRVSSSRRPRSFVAGAASAERHCYGHRRVVRSGSKWPLALGQKRNPFGAPAI